MTRHFPFIDPKIQNELDFEKWPPAQSIPTPAPDPCPSQKQYFRFLSPNGPDTGTLTHNGPSPEGLATRTRTTPGSHPQGQDHC